MTNIDPYADRRGKCYDLAASYVLAHAQHDSAMLLCHGWPTLTAGPYKGQRYGHAWVERTIEMRMPVNDRIMKVPIEECWDTVTDTWIAKTLYYIGGKINGDHVTTYNYAEACVEMNESDTYGPWQEPPHDIAPFADEE